MGASVNSCVPSDVYDDIPFNLKYLTIDQVVERIQLIGPTALLFNVDLERAFQNLLLKSVQMNAKMNIKVKGVISVNMLKRLMEVVHKYYNEKTYKALFLTAYFCFFRLASLLPHTVGSFDRPRYPIVDDANMGETRSSHYYHMRQKYAKFRSISCCPITRVEKCIDLSSVGLEKHVKRKKESFFWSTFIPNLYTERISSINCIKRLFLSQTCIASMGMNPSHYTFHSFRRSGASWAFDSSVALENINNMGTGKVRHCGCI